MNEQQLAVQAMRKALEADPNNSWILPTVMDSSTFLNAELTELLLAIVIRSGRVSDVLLRLGYGAHQYSRNNHRDSNISQELGDMQLMLCTLATLLGIDLDVALHDRLQHFITKAAQANDAQ